MCFWCVFLLFNCCVYMACGWWKSGFTGSVHDWDPNLCFFLSVFLDQKGHWLQCSKPNSNGETVMHLTVIHSGLSTG